MTFKHDAMIAAGQVLQKRGVARTASLVDICRHFDDRSMAGRRGAVSLVHAGRCFETKLTDP
jgi:hypothetical protein